MQKTKHAERGDNRETLVEHRDTYEQWRELLVAEHILSENGLIDVELLEKKHPNVLDKNQIIWLEAMQKGEIIEEGDDVELDDPEAVEEAQPVTPVKQPAENREPEPEPEAAEDESVEEVDKDLALPPVPKKNRKAKAEAERTYKIGDVFKIQVEAGNAPEEVTVTKITRDAIHLAPSEDDESEYSVRPEELAEMIVS
ncbi:MAG: hypothetical protein WC813_01605 [Patescibacteria group bacterium]|jgi:hypothetical protein